MRLFMGTDDLTDTGSYTRRKCVWQNPALAPGGPAWCLVYFIAGGIFAWQF